MILTIFLVISLISLFGFYYIGGTVGPLVTLVQALFFIMVGAAGTFFLAIVRNNKPPESLLETWQRLNPGEFFKAGMEWQQIKDWLRAFGQANEVDRSGNTRLKIVSTLLVVVLVFLIDQQSRFMSTCGYVRSLIESQSVVHGKGDKTAIDASTLGWIDNVEDGCHPFVKPIQDLSKLFGEKFHQQVLDLYKRL